MNKSLFLALAAIMSMAVSGCSHAPKMFWGLDEGTDQQAKGAKTVKAEVRPALEVPPELRGKVEVPEAAKVATEEKLPKRYSKRVAGKKVALDARLYEADAATVFSATIDAMSALNLPVDSVDSASGTITTDWVRTDANTTSENSFVKGFDLFGASGARAVRYRYLVRVMRLRGEESTTNKTRLEIRTTGQAFIGNHWVNKKLKRKYANELFSRLEERLGNSDQ